MTISISSLPTAQVQYLLQHLIAPRPICFASTINRAGQVNLSPFSFFNLFSTNPPIVVFSPARRVRNNTTKHTLENLYEVPETVINIVSYHMVQQVSLASCEYPQSINEFVKAGFTPEAAHMVTPPMVKESKAKLECRINQIIPLGQEGGAGNLVIAEVLCMHIDDDLLPDGKTFAQDKLDLVARLGGDWYAHISADNLFKVPKPNTKTGIGFDALPPQIRNSTVLTGNHLAQLANVEQMPERDPGYQVPQQYANTDPHHYAKQLIDSGNIEKAWQVLLQDYNIHE